MKEMLDLITNYGVGMVALSAVFYFSWYIIQNVAPILLDLKMTNDMNIEVIRNNTEAIHNNTEALGKIEASSNNQIKDHQQMMKNYEVHNERTIRVEQNLSILLDRSNIDKQQIVL